MKPTIDDLAAICTVQDHRAIGAPFASLVWGDWHVVATDGYCVLLLRDDTASPRFDVSDAPDLGATFPPWGEAIRVTGEAVRAWAVMRAETAQQCRICNGETIHKCLGCGQGHECGACNGTGKGPIPMRGRAALIRTAPAVVIDLALFRKVLGWYEGDLDVSSSWTPYAPISWRAPDDDSWTAVIMPVRIDPGGGDYPPADLAPLIPSVPSVLAAEASP